MIKVEPEFNATGYTQGWVSIDPERGLSIELPRPVKRVITLNYRDITHLIRSARRGQKFLNVYDSVHVVNGPDGSPQPERIGEIWSDQNGTWWANCWLGDTHPVRMYRTEDNAKTAFQRHVRRYHK